MGMVPHPETGSYVPDPSFLERLIRSHPDFCSDLMPSVQFLAFDPPLDSSSIESTHWTVLATLISNNYTHDGFVIIHGTDTMAYTASALSFALDHLTKPVVLTGSLIPLSILRNDAFTNLLDALLIAARSAIPEVLIVFNGRILRGNRATKVSCISIDAFQSPNAPPLGTGGTKLLCHPRRILRRVVPGGPRATSPVSAPHTCLYSERVVVIQVFPHCTDPVAQWLAYLAQDPEGPTHTDTPTSTRPPSPLVVPASPNSAPPTPIPQVSIRLSDGRLGVLTPPRSPTFAVVSPIPSPTTPPQTSSTPSHKSSPTTLSPWLWGQDSLQPNQPPDPPPGAGSCPTHPTSFVLCPPPPGTQSPHAIATPCVAWDPDLGVCRVYEQIPTNANTQTQQQPAAGPSPRPGQPQTRYGVVLVAYGSGTIPQRQQLLDAIAHASARGVVVVVVSACLEGEVVLSSYAASSSLIEAGAVSGSDLTVEAAYAKLAWLLAQPRGTDPEWVRLAMQISIQGEMTQQLALKETDIAESLMRWKMVIF